MLWFLFANGGRIMELISELFQQLSEVVIYLLEFIGIFIIIIGTIQGMYYLVKSKFNFKDPNAIIQLAESFSMSLSFILGAEIIQTMLSTDLRQVLSLASIVVIRVLLTVFLHWEINEFQKK